MSELFNEESLHEDANNLYDAYSQWADEFSKKIKDDNQLDAGVLGSEVLMRYMAEYYIEMHGKYDEYRLWSDSVAELMQEWQENVKNLINDEKKES